MEFHSESVKHIVCELNVRRGLRVSNIHECETAFQRQQEQSVRREGLKRSGCSSFRVRVRVAPASELGVLSSEFRAMYSAEQYTLS